MRSCEEPVPCKKCRQPSLRNNYGFCNDHRQKKRQAEEASEAADNLRQKKRQKPRHKYRTNASTLTSPGGSSYVKEGFSLKRTVDEMLACKKTEFSPEKMRLVRYINGHTDQKYTAVSANPQKKRDRSRWLWRHCMQKCDGDENIAASLIHDAATSLTNVRVNACAHSYTHPYNIALNIPTAICCQLLRDDAVI